MKTIFLLITSLLFLVSPCFAQKTQSKCREWQKRIEATTSFYFRDDDDKSEKQIFDGIECLLKLEGKKVDSNVGGANRGDVSQIFSKPTSVEVAALYYITYLVYQEWDYADAPYLTNKEGQLNTSTSVATAYKAYRTWINKVKKIGLEEARKQKPDPLAGLKVSWY